MNLKSPKFRLKIKRVLFLTLGWVAAGIYISTIQHVTIMIVLDKVDHSYPEMILKTIAEVFLPDRFWGYLKFFISLINITIHQLFLIRLYIYIQKILLSVRVNEFVTS